MSTREGHPLPEWVAQYRRHTNLLAVLVVVVAAGLIGVGHLIGAKETIGPCDARAVAEQILVAERPQMGPLERRFWLDVLARHYEGHGLSAALGASLLAQENQFKTYRVSSTGAQGAFQVMPTIWKGTPECPKDSNLFEVEVAAECSARILEKYTKEGGSVEAGLRHYVGGYYGQAKAQWYADQIITRLARATAQCPAFRELLVAEKKS